jgi:hypothetical protein
VLGSKVRTWSVRHGEGLALSRASSLDPFGGASRGCDSKSYGQPEELRGVTRIFVDAGGELDLRGVMAQTLAKRLPQVSIVPESSYAEIVLGFTYSRDSAKSDSFDGRLLATRISAGKIRYVASYRHDEANSMILQKRSCFSSSSSTSRSTVSRSKASSNHRSLKNCRRRAPSGA